MARATDAQVQNYAGRVRQRMEQIRNLGVNSIDDKVAFEAVHEHINETGGGEGIPMSWTDSHQGGPPHLVDKSILNAFDTVNFQLRALFRGEAVDHAAFKSAYDVAVRACVREPVT